MGSNSDLQTLAAALTLKQPRDKCGHSPRSITPCKLEAIPESEPAKDGTFIRLTDGKKSIGKDLKFNPFCYNVQFEDSEEFGVTGCTDLRDWEIKEDESEPRKGLFGWTVEEQGDLYTCMTCGITICTGCYERAWNNKDAEFPNGYHLKRVRRNSDGFRWESGVFVEDTKHLLTQVGYGQDDFRRGKLRVDLSDTQKKLYDERIEHELNRTRRRRDTAVPSRSVSPLRE